MKLLKYVLSDFDIPIMYINNPQLIIEDITTTHNLVKDSGNNKCNIVGRITDKSDTNIIGSSLLTFLLDIS